MDNLRVIVSAAGLVASLAAVAAGQATDAARPAQSVVEGVYNAEQGKRGQGVFLDECSRCHAESLAGTEFAPPLIGESFLQGWNGRSVGDLFELIRDNMPADGPGRLSPTQVTDLVAFVLKSNGFPAAQQPLKSDVASMKGIRIENPK